MFKNTDDLHPIETSLLQARRERVFLIFAGLFLGSMTMLNILGISRFLKIFEWNYQFASGETWPIIFAVAGCVLMPLPFFAAPRNGKDMSPASGEDHVPMIKAIKLAFTHPRFLGLIALFSGSQMSLTIMTAAAQEQSIAGNSGEKIR